MFDWNEQLRETAAHLLRMANSPGWQEHARERRDQLLAEPVWGEALKAEIQRQRAQTKGAVDE